jgi:hypothetical protein
MRVFISRVVRSELNDFCLHSFQKKNAAEIAKEVWTREENPSCQRSSTTERGVKVTPTFSTTDWVRHADAPEANRKDFT